MADRATLYRGHRRETAVEVELVRITPEIATAPCPECEGTGWWDYAEPEVPGSACVECKGAGRIYVSA